MATRASTQKLPVRRAAPNARLLILVGAPPRESAAGCWATRSAGRSRTTNRINGISSSGSRLVQAKAERQPTSAMSAAFRGGQRAIAQAGPSQGNTHREAPVLDEPA